MKNKRYNNIEEWANTLSHGIGILLGIVAGYLLLEKASKNIEPQWAVACVSVYLAGMLSSYVSSTWYHGSRPGKLKELLRKFDHGAIYLHIAGTYTPFTLLVLRHAGGWGWGIFAFVWLSAIAGFILSFKKLKEHSNLETACYVGMGACILVAMKPLLDHLGELGATTAFWWLIGGGVSYIVGAVFYSLRKPYMHATFHLFCLGGQHRAYHCHLADSIRNSRDKKKAIYPRQPIFVNLKSNTMKNTIQRYGLFGYLQIFEAKQPNL